MGWITKAVGWVVAHKDAIATGFKVFQSLRGRRKETQVTGESVKDFYLRKGVEAVREQAEFVSR